MKKINRSIEREIEIRIDTAAKFIASLSSSGRIIASSNFAFATFPKMREIAVNRESIPISSGVYILVKMGEMITGITWDIVVPVTSVMTFFEN